jgi:thiamine biosynthesis lipoprotein
MELHNYPFKAMGGPCQVKLYANTKTEADTWATIAIDEVGRLEKKYSRYLENSVTGKINSDGHKGINLDDETAVLINYADQLHAQSDGLFDITSGVLRYAWDFKSGAIPSQSKIDELLPLIGWHKVIWDAPYLKFPIAGMQLDFGGYVKEYAADAAANACREHGARHGLVELGGDISIIGPSIDNRGWAIGIRNPRKPNSVATSITLLSGGLASSGDYERFFVVDGRRYSHILNPVTGWPIDTLASVSVVADHCLLAGSLTTIAMLKGEQLGLSWLQSTSVHYYCISSTGEISRSENSISQTEESCV